MAVAQDGQGGQAPLPAEQEEAYEISDAELAQLLQAEEENGINVIGLPQQQRPSVFRPGRRQ